jgi:hypothetical protein
VATPVDAEIVNEVTYEVSNMAEVDDSTFHLTYMDGKEITFQVHEENIPSPRASQMQRRENQQKRSLEDDRLQGKNRVQISIETIPIGEESKIRTVEPLQGKIEKEISSEGVDKDKSGISSANLVLNRQRWVREHPMERRN